MFSNCGLNMNAWIRLRRALVVPTPMCVVLYRTQILELRKREMRYVFWELMHWAGYISILIVFPIFAMTVTFATYAEGMLSLEGRDKSLAAPAPAPAPVPNP
jgi:hypothetical protein